MICHFSGLFYNSLDTTSINTIQLYYPPPISLIGFSCSKTFLSVSKNVQTGRKNSARLGSPLYNGHSKSLCTVLFRMTILTITLPRISDGIVRHTTVIQKVANRREEEKGSLFMYREQTFKKK